MKYLVLFENGEKAFYVPQAYPFVPVVGDTIKNSGLEIVVLKRSFEWSEGDAQWIGVLVVKNA